MTRSLVLPIPSTLLILFLALLPSSAFLFPSDCEEPTSDSCPTCCKNLRNLAPAGDPAKVFRNVKHVDRCIALCHNYTFFGLSNRHVCGCFNECSVIEVPASPFAVTSGFVKACMTPCFTLVPGDATDQCPQHATRLAVGEKGTKCCCKAPFSQPKFEQGRMICSLPEGKDEVGVA